MTEPLPFAIAAFALLAAPGPTNALLATSAASAGALRSLQLVLGAALGYLIATLAVALVLSPLADASHALDVTLRALCGGYLAFAAWRLWSEGEAVNDGAPLQFHRVLLATSLNPKGVVLATVIVPHLRPISVASGPYLAALAGLAVLAGGMWLALGGVLRKGVLLDARAARRAGAVVLAIFAVLVAGSAFTA